MDDSKTSWETILIEVFFTISIKLELHFKKDFHCFLEIQQVTVDLKGIKPYVDDFVLRGTIQKW